MIDYTTLDINSTYAETLNDHKWITPSSYAGHNPEGAVVLAVQTRDSAVHERSNFVTVRKAIDALETVLADPNEDSPHSPYDFRAGHWSCGWVEYLIIPSSAPLAVLELAGEILCALSEYPIFDDEHCSEMEYNEVTSYWEQCSVADRIELCAENDISIFAARHDCMPQDDNGSLYQQIAYA